MTTYDRATDPEREIERTGYCELHQRIDCDLCDECGHGPADHLNGHDLPAYAARLVFDHATCWAENVCRSCDPAMHQRVMANLKVDPRYATSGWTDG